MEYSILTYLLYSVPEFILFGLLVLILEDRFRRINLKKVIEIIVVPSFIFCLFFFLIKGFQVTILDEIIMQCVLLLSYLLYVLEKIYSKNILYKSVLYLVVFFVFTSVNQVFIVMIFILIGFDMENPSYLIFYSSTSLMLISYIILFFILNKFNINIRKWFRD